MISKMSFCWLTIVQCIAVGVAVKFPGDIKRCAIADSECITNSANDVVFKNAKDGRSDINMIALDPLNIPMISIKQGADSPVNIELNFKDVDLIGMKGCPFTKIQGFNKDPNGPYKFRSKGPVMYMIGQYTINGRILILPIQGAGNSNITLYNPDMLFKFDGRGVTRRGREYLQIENATLTFTVSRIHFDFQNLYNGDKLLGSTTNLFLNENWKDIFGEIKPSIFETFSLIMKQAVAQIFQKVPYDEIFAS